MRPIYLYALILIVIVETAWLLGDKVTRFVPEKADAFYIRTDPDAKAVPLAQITGEGWSCTHLPTAMKEWEKQKKAEKK